MFDWTPFQSKLPSDLEVQQLSADILALTKWNWDYQACLEVQNNAVEFVHQYPNKKIYIFCNHPQLYTMGRGNQRDMQDALPDPNFDQLPYPVHKIFRGGGLTFHCPGQWIFYPICKLNAKDYTLNDHLCFLQKLVQRSLDKMYQIKAEGRRNPLGVWVGHQKIASIGVGLQRYITYHGIALNLNEDSIFESLAQANPCGLTGNTYISAEKLLGQTTSVSQFQQHILRELHASKETALPLS